MNNSNLIGFCAISLVVGALAGWGITSLSQKANGPQTAASFSAGTTGTCSGGAAVQPGELFVLDGITYSQEQLPGELKEFYFNENFQTYQKTRAMVEEVALRMALSKSTDLGNLPPLDQLLPKTKVTEKDVKKFYDEKKSTIPAHVTFDQVKPQIEKYLEAQKIANAATDEIKKLEKNGRLNLLIAAPIPPVVKIETESFPSLGPSDAKYTLIEVSDYMCGHCQRVHPEVKEVLKKLKNKVKFVQINYSLNPNGMSGTWVRGAYCAQQESNDKFWKYHHAAFDVQSKEIHDHSSHAHGEHREDEAENFKKAKDVASTAGLDLQKFEACLKGEDSNAFILKTNQMLASNGVSGTPTFFLNNVKVQMTQPSLLQSIEAAMQ